MRVSKAKGTPAREVALLGGYRGGSFRVRGIMNQLRPFQREFIKRALALGVDVAALSIPRGNGKAGWPRTYWKGLDAWGCSLCVGR